MDGTPELPKLVKADALARHLDLPLWRLYELCRQGEIPHVRIGRSIRFDPAAVGAWIRRGGAAGELR